MGGIFPTEIIHRREEKEKKIPKRACNTENNGPCLSMTATRTFHSSFYPSQS